MKKTYHLNANQKNAESDKIGFKTKKSTRDRKIFHNMSQHIRKI